MTKAAKTVAQPVVILFGLSSIGKPRAGVFRGTAVPAAQKAASKLGLHIFEVSDQAGRTLAAKVPAGRIQAHGEAVVPFVPKQLYASIESLARPKPNDGTAEIAGPQQPARSGPRLPASWDDIRVGDQVLAQDADPADGWWQAIVVEKVGDIFKLRWPRSERGRPFQKHRLTIGLICPIEARPGPPSDPKKSSAAASRRFPQDWAAIGLNQIVLAKEDGPCEQWWEAKTIKLDKDVFTLQWRDYPNLPPIERPRSSLGLMHPAPKAR